VARNDSLLNRLTAPGVLLVVTALFAGLFIAPSFESTRPRSPQVAYAPHEAAQRAPGLITFDPLEQAYETAGSAPWKPTAEGAAEQRFPLETLVEALAAPGQERSLLLLESVRGGALSEDHERRLRGRFATVSALVREGFFPRHSKWLELAWLPFEDFAPQCGVLVPFETFQGEPEHSQYRRVVVAWLDEAAIERDPLGVGLEFERAVRERLRKRGGDGADEQLDVRWLGPTTSGRLEELLASRLDRQAQCATSKLKIATPYATSPLIELPPTAAWNADGLSLARAVNTDDVLARLLVHELVLRVPALLPLHHGGDTTREKASPSWVRTLATPLKWLQFIPAPRDGAKVRVALVVEQDSSYGQAWVSNLRAAREALSAEHPQLSTVDFTVYPVFGWVDGIARESKDKSSATSFARDYPAEGHQLDYLQRLRDELAEAGRFDAVGVFVTEEYDTMLILEALRPQFPAALFLSTDLDSRYLHPRHAPFTRNLIVASHFPLAPVDSQFRDGSLDAAAATPHFRDGYQSGVYLAVRALLRGREPEPPASAAIYEIGRDAIVPLNTHIVAREQQQDEPGPSVYAPPQSPTHLERAARTLGAPSVAAAESSAAPHATPAFAYKWAFVSCTLLVLGFLLFGVSTRAARASGLHADARVVRALLVFVLAALLALAFVEGLLRAQASYHAEPMHLALGVSAWPTFAVRCASIAVCLFGLYSLPLRLRRRLERIAPAGKTAPEPASFAWLADWGWLAKETDQHGHVASRRVEQVWAFARRHLEHPWRTRARAVALALVTYFVIAPFFMLSPPLGNPVRGEFAYLVDRLTLFASVFSFLALLMLVMEATYFAGLIVARLVDADAVELDEAGKGDADRWRRRLELAGSVAAAVEPLVWLPMLTLGLMIVARAALFDAWAWPVVLMGVFALFFSMLLVCVVDMRHLCERARTRALDALAENSDATTRARGQGADALAHLQRLRGEIAGLTGGAFSPLLEHPFVRALLLPLTAFGATFAFERSLLERLLGSL
jgi:hypothetical protein